MLGIRPSCQIHAAFPDQLERQRRTKPMDLCQVHPQHCVQGRPSIKGRGIGRVVAVTGGGQWPSRVGHVAQPPQHRRDLHVTIRKLGLVGVIKLQRLAKGKDMLVAPVPSQCCPDDFYGGVAAPVAMNGQCRSLAHPQ